MIKHTTAPKIHNRKNGMLSMVLNVHHLVHKVMSIQVDDISLGAFMASELDVVFSGYQPR
jgi:hypothetical protein